MNAKYLAVELDTMPDGSAIRAQLAKVTCLLLLLAKRMACST